MSNNAFGRVSDWMVSPVCTVEEDATLTQALQLLESIGTSALPVVDASARLVGLLGRADVLRAGRFVSQSPERERPLHLPNMRAVDFMRTRVPVIRPGLSLGACARRMLKQRVHRLYAVEDGPLVGVVTTREMRGAVAKAGIDTSLGALAQRSIALIAAQETLASAMARLRGAPESTLVVTQNGDPVGVFSRAEAAAAREADPTEAVQLWMDPYVLPLPGEMAAHQGAQRVYDQKGRYIIVQEAGKVTGLISGLGFADLVSAHSD
jgi:predicted transcriptional regulator